MASNAPSPTADDSVPAMASFTVQASCAGAARAGAWGALATPAPLLHTSYGQPPHLLRDTLTLLPQPQTAAAAVQYPHFWDHDAAVAASGRRDLAAYLGLPNRAAVLTMRDPSAFAKPEASDTTLTVSMVYGRRKVAFPDYMTALFRMKPHAAVVLHDEVPLGVGNNRTKACVSRSLAWLAQSIDSVKKLLSDAAPPAKMRRLDDGSTASGGGHAPTLATGAHVPAAGSAPPLIAFVPLVGDERARTRARTSVLELVQGANAWAAERDVPPLVAGYLVGNVGMLEGADTRDALLAECVAALPAAGVRMVCGIGAPAEVLRAVALGVDVFDTDYPTVLTNHALAATFQFSYATFEATLSEPAPLAVASATATVAPAPADVVTPPAPTAESDNGCYDAQARAKYVARLLDGDTTLLNMRLRQYSEDTAPLVPGCTCLACNGVADGDVSHFAAGTPAGAAAREVLHPGHTRAYIHHLVNAGELLSKVLLQAHNVTHYAGFFAAIRAAIQAGKLNEYTAWLLAVNHFA